jgi:hypothetical protein
MPINPDKKIGGFNLSVIPSSEWIYIQKMTNG